MIVTTLRRCADDSLTDAELRAMTPPGFAWAFYEANKEVDE